MELMDIYEIFYNYGNKEQADELTTQREQYIVNIINNNDFMDKYIDHLKHNDIKKLHDNLLEKIKDLYNDYDKVTATHIGGKKNHYDIKLIYSKGKTNTNVYLEYKHNAINFNGIPEFYQPFAYTFIDGIKIDEYHYDHNLIHCLSLFNKSFNIPTKQKYGTLVYKLGNYTKGSMLDKLHNMKKSGEYVEEFNKFSELSNKSIKEYLKLIKSKGGEYNEDEVSYEATEDELDDKNIPKIDLGEISQTLIDTQKGKYFLFFKNGEFYLDSIDKKELVVVKIKKITHNTIILATKIETTTISLMLRWKNNIGILNLAWQIKLIRS